MANDLDIFKSRTKVYDDESCKLNCKVKNYSTDHKICSELHLTTDESERDMSENSRDDGDNDSDYKFVRSMLSRHNEKECTQTTAKKSNTLSNQETDDNDSDSDMTEVSPLPSPRSILSSSTSGSNERRNSISEVEQRRPVLNLNKRSDNAGYMKSDLFNEVQLLSLPKQNSLNLGLLEQAIIELDKGEHCSSADVLSNENMISNPTKNYSFSSSRVRDIDIENQRLMNKIMHYAKETKERKKQPKCTMKLTPVYHSAMRRKKDHQRIEEENLVCIMIIMLFLPMDHII